MKDFLSKDDIIKLLGLFPEPYSRLVVSKKQPSLIKNEMNKELVNKLVSIDILSSKFSVKKGMIKVYVM